jgi:hypothetical protein
MIGAGILFWPPLISSYDGFASNSSSVHSAEDIDIGSRLGTCPGGEGYSRKEIADGAACYERAKAQAEGEVWVTNAERLSIWLTKVFFVPLILPVFLIGLAIVAQWISDGYRNRVS